MKKLVKSMLMVGSSTSANMLVAIVRNKLMAVMLGPSGLGFFAQLTGLQNLVAGLVPMGMQEGVVRYVAKYRAEDPAKLKSFVITASRLFLLLSVVSTILCLVLIKPLAAWVLDESRHFLFLLPAILGIPLIVQSRLHQTFLQASMEVKLYSKALVVTSVFGLITLVPMVLEWGLPGAAVHLLLFALLGYVVASMYSKRTLDKSLKSEENVTGLDRLAVRNLFRFGFASLPNTFFLLFVPFFVRIKIISDLGFEANGIYQVIYAVSTQYLVVPISAMATYTLPKISSLRDVKDINQEINIAVRGVLLFSTAAILTLLLGRDLFVRLLFTDKFLPAIALFPLQLLGDLIKAVAWAIGLPTLPQERFRARIVLISLRNAVFLGVFFLTPAESRLFGAVLAYSVAYGVNLVSTYLYMHWLNGFKFDRKAGVLLLTSLTAVTIVAFLPLDFRWRAAGVAISVVWVLISVQRQDWMKFVAMLRERFQRKKAI